MTKFCHNCGASLPDIAKFCASCGEQVSARSEQPVKSRVAPKRDRIKGNGAYVRWYFFYFFFFLPFFPLYIITTILAFTPIAEKLWRKVSGIRPLRLKSEKDRLLPLFKEVYTGAFEADANLSKSIKLYIKEDMTINAFAFGKSTLVLTRGSLELLNDDCLKGLIAHEFGHFSHGDTEAILLTTVSNFFMSYMVSKLTDKVNRYSEEKQSGITVAIVKGIYHIFKAIDSLGELILKRTSRRNEYYADQFASNSGFTKELTDVLIEIYAVSISKPQSVKEQLKSTHPDITLRIERLEETLYE